MEVFTRRVPLPCPSASVPFTSDTAVSVVKGSPRAAARARRQRRANQHNHSMLSRQTARELLTRMTGLGIAREDLEETFMRGSGHGGQKVNKTSSTVRLKHVPTGIEVRCQEERSLAQNRALARSLLCDKLEAHL